MGSFCFLRCCINGMIEVMFWRGQLEKRNNTGIYHIMLRGINRQTIFEDNEDMIRFLDTLARYKDDCLLELYSYCLMGNHVHLLMKTAEPISKIIKRICSSYVYWYNKRYERCGHLFQEGSGAKS